MTPDQQAADAAVADALRSRLATYAEEDQPLPGVVTAWVAVLTTTDFDDDGAPITRYLIASPGEQAVHVDLGLLAYGTRRANLWCDPDLD